MKKTEVRGQSGRAQVHKSTSQRTEWQSTSAQEQQRTEVRGQRSEDREQRTSGSWLVARGSFPPVTSHQSIRYLLFAVICGIAIQPLLLPIASLYAGGTTSATFLKLGVGARPVAMGSAFVAIADDVNSMVWNPAGLINIGKKEFSFMHLEHFQSIRYNSLSYAQPVGNNVLGFGLGYLATDDIRRTFIDINQYSGFRDDGSYNMENRTFFAAGSRKIADDKSAGVLVRWLSEKIENHTADGFAMDIGYLHLLTDNILFGLSVQNIGSTLKFIAHQEKLPVIFRGGLGFTLLDEKLKLASDIVWPIDYQPSINFGGEYKIMDFLTLRCGWRFKSLFRDDYLGIISAISAGLGFNFYNYSMDYAFVPYGDLGYSHRISLGGRF